MTCHTTTTTITPPFNQVNETKSTLIALAGQPNQGKSTIFNLLTGLNQHVGNWPGKTVEHREGTFRYRETLYRLVDLPGTYSLTANSPDELVAREFILQERPNLVVAVVNAANLERSLYLVAELIGLPIPLIIALNMMDVAEQEGIQVEAPVLQAALGVPVIPMSASRSQGFTELLQAIQPAIQGVTGLSPHPPQVRADHQALYNILINQIQDYTPNAYPASWCAVKLMEGDAEITRDFQQILPAERWQVVQTALQQHDDAMVAIASGRYEWIDRMIRAAVVRPRLGQISLTERIDRWAAHPIGGLFVLAAILGALFWLTFTLGTPVQAWLENQIILPLTAATRVALAGAPTWVNGLLTDGVLGGAGAVLTFFPILAIFFAAFGVLEDVGYMARAAYVMDNFMHLMGLHGQSFLPLFLGFGCNVPAVMGTRVVDSRPARLLSILIAPFVPCTARMAVIAFIAPIFFGAQAALVAWGLILLALGVLVLSGIILNHTVFRGQRSAFIMEMPLYHIPNWRTIGLLVWRRLLEFLKKAGTIILTVSALLWLLSALPDGKMENSLLAQVGRLFEPVGRLMGLDWRLSVALLSSFVAKENAVATLGVLFHSQSDAGLAAAIAAAYSPAVGIAFLVVVTLFIPCLATVAAIRQESGSWRWAVANLALMLGISLGAGTLAYHLALGFGG